MAIKGNGGGAAPVQKRGGAGSRLQKLAVLLAMTVSLMASPVSAQITFTTPPSNTIVALGSPARFDCEISAFVSVSVSWEKDGVSIFSQGRFDYLDNSSLLIDPTQAGDNGTYTCVVTDLTSQQPVERSATLRFAFILSSFDLSPEDQTVNPGDSLLLFCTHAGSLPAASITWTHNDDVVVTSSRIFISQSVLGHVDPPQVSSSLAITSILSTDAGSYACIASNPLLPSSPVTSSQGTLTVRAPPSPPTITVQPDDVIVITGQSASFSCSADGQPLPTITWTLNDVGLAPSNQVTITNSGQTSILTIAGVQEVNVGAYRCQAINSQGSVTSQPASLQTASISMTFELQPEDEVAVIGSDVILNCLPPPSQPPTVVTWTKNSIELTGPRFQILGNGSLAISGVLLEDQDDYRCTATNQLLGISRTSQAARLAAIGAPSIVPETVTVNSGQSVTLLCSARGIPAPTFSWFKGQTQLLDGDPRLTVSGGTLRISDIVVDDRGYYTCRADFTVGGRTESQAFISVRSPPEFVNTNIAITSITGSQATLPCDIILDLTISFTWQFDGASINPSTSAGTFTILSNGSLVISTVADSHEGTFTCVATNTLGTAEGNVTLTVYTPPTITPGSTSVVVTEGEVATLTCTATGDPIPDQTWSRNGTQLTPGGRYQISSDGRVLTVQQVNEEQDEGVFTCHASNDAGSDSADIAVSVQVLPSASATPTSQQLPAGETVSFDCVVNGDPAPQLRWLNSASIDVTTLSDSRIQVLTNGTLIISDLRASDQQQFVCEATNAIGRNMAAVSLLVTVSPSVSLPATTTAVQGNPLTLDCNPIGQPSPSVAWYRDSVRLTSGSRVSIDAQGRLIFSSVIAMDGGSYRCEATSLVGMATASTSLSVLVTPIIQPELSPMTAVENSRAVLDCVASGNPPPTISWFFNSVPLPSPSSPRIQQSTNGSLVFSPVEKGDEGSYVCRASNDVGTESATFQLRVYVAPVVTAAESSITVIEGSTATLTCLATGDPVPDQTWSRNGTQLTSGGRYQISSDGRVLTVQQVNEEQDEGVLTCHASNDAGSDSADIALSVLIRPSFTEPLANSTAVEGEQHVLTCTAAGDPAPLISWSSSEGVVSSQGTLLFSSVARGNTGFYTCTATSSAGSVSSEIYLDVLYPPSILQPPTSQSVALNSTAQLVCVADGNPSPQILWHLDDVLIQGATESTYVISMVMASSGGQYTCTATNILSTVSQRATLTVLFPPSSPNLLFASATSPTTFSVQWAASTNDGGSPITSYVVEYRDSSLSSSPFQVSRVNSDISSTQLDGLAAFVNYEIRVRAENAVGLSDPSNALFGRTHPDAPAAPGNFRVTSSDSTSLSLGWEVPNPLNGQLAVYELRYTNEDTSERQSRLLFSVTEFRIVGLLSGVTYRIELRASTRGLLGDSLWGPYAVLRVRDGMELEVPTETPPTTATPTTQAETTTQELATTPASTTLEPTSQVGVATTEVATTTEEDMDTSAPSTTVPEATTTVAVVTTTPALNLPTVAPSQVLLHIPAGSFGQLEVIWREPSTGLGTFIGYQIMISPAPPPPLTTPILQTPPSDRGPFFYSIVGLANFTTYTITVATYNTDGVGPLTAQATETTPEALPSPPLGVEAVALSSQTAVTISWSPPDPRNGVILQYLIQISAASTGQAVASRTVAIGSSTPDQEGTQLEIFTGLDLANVRYRIEVYASTSVGQGPSSIPVFVGMDSGNVITTTTDSQPTTTEQPQGTTVEAPPMTSEASPITDNATPSTDSSTVGLPTTTDTPSPVRTDEYYIIRIVPPVVVVLFILAIVFAVAMGLIVRSRRSKERKKGLYSFDASRGYTMKNRNIHEDEGIVAGDDNVETSSYHIKDALDANFTYSHSNMQPSSFQYGRGQPGMGQVRRGQLHGTSGGRFRGPAYQSNTGGQALDDSSWYNTSGRDAAQEPGSRPDSGEIDIMPAQIRDSGSTLGSQSEESISSSQRLPYLAGDYPYAEMDAIRARKAQERAQRFGVDGQHPLHQQQRQAPAGPQMTFDPNLGFSNGGLMETRIGAVGDSRARDHIPPEASAQMY